MPRKVNIELTYKLKIEEAERKHKESLASAELAFKTRLEKIEAWKLRETTLAQDVQGRLPRISKEAQELLEAKERQKQMLEEGKKKAEERKQIVLDGGIPEPTVGEKERADIFDMFAALQEDSEGEEEESEDEWDLTGMSEEGQKRYLKSRQSDGAEIPNFLLHLLEEGEKVQENPPDQKTPEMSEAPAIEPPAPHTFQKNVSESVHLPIYQGESKKSQEPPLHLTIEPEEPPVIISNTKMKKLIKRVPWKQND